MSFIKNPAIIVVWYSAGISILGFVSMLLLPTTNTLGVTGVLIGSMGSLVGSSLFTLQNRIISLEKERDAKLKSG